MMQNFKYILVIIIAINSCYLTAQTSLSQQVISSTGNYSEGNSITLSATVGEPIVTTETSTTYIITQGFQQPLEITVNLDFHIYTGISPNGDDVNDSWEIDGINDFPDNSVTIFNRWGNEVWKKSNYNNVAVVWKGNNSDGKPLADGTYFYIIKVGSQTKKGWVEVTR